jgi:inosine/xanthosine triphosphate pyrophosphatase family protein
VEILLATSNEYKAKAVQATLGRPVQHLKIDLPEVQTIEVKEVIEHKAREAYHLVGKPVLVEDTSLAVQA